MENIYYHIWLGVFVFVAFAVRAFFDAHNSTRRKRIDGRGSSNMTYLGFACSFAQISGLDLSMNLPEPYNSIARVCGLVLAPIACLLMTWPRVMTVRNSTWASPTTSPLYVPGHQLVTSGPYRLVRHPYYLGVLLGFLATELCLASCFLALFPYFLNFVHQTACAEEAQLEERYGETYREYNRTWRLPPFFY